MYVSSDSEKTWKPDIIITTCTLAHTITIRVSTPPFLNKSCLKKQFLRVARLCNVLSKIPFLDEKEFNIELQQQITKDRKTTAKLILGSLGN